MLKLLSASAWRNKRVQWHMDQGNEPVQAILLIALAAILLIGLRAVANAIFDRTILVASRLTDGNTSSQLAESDDASLPEWNTASDSTHPSSHNPTANNTDTFGRMRLGDVLPSLTGPLSNWSVRKAALTMARLSEASYNTYSGPTKVDDFDLLAQFHGPQGFAASVFSKWHDGRQIMVLAIRGTETEPLLSLATVDDVVTDVWNVFFGDEQYIEAIKTIRGLQRQYPDAQWLLTGHSLGGGAAAFAAAMKGMTAIVLNAAGPSYPHLASVGLADLIRKIQGDAVTRNILHVNTKRDPLTNSIFGRPWSHHVYTIGDSGRPSPSAHFIATLVSALQSQQPLLPQ